jgi:hypothetical protein
MADFLGFGEVAEWFKAAVLKTAPENTGKARKCANPLQILGEIGAFAIRSRGTPQHRRRHMGSEWPKLVELSKGEWFTLMMARAEREDDPVACAPLRPFPVFSATTGAAKAEQVYFIGTRDCVKIGISRDISYRLRHMQTGNAHRLELLAVAEGGRVLERHYHKLFATYRLHGEWFTRSPEIEAEIARIGGGV